MALKDDMIGQQLLKIKREMNLTEEELLQMHKYLIDHKDDKELLSSLIKSDMSEKQKIFLAYIRGIGQEYINESERSSKKDERKYFDQIDAFESISSGFSGWDMIEIARTFSSVLKAMMINTLDNKDISGLAMQMSDDFCRFSEDYEKFKELSDSMQRKRGIMKG